MGTAALATGQFIQGQDEAANINAQAEVEKLNARSREIARRRRLLDTIASQSSIQGASGFDVGTGSHKNIPLSDIKKFEEDQAIDDLNTDRKVQQIRKSADRARLRGFGNAASTSLLRF